MNLASDDRQLGEYRLKELISESELARTWLAEQVSVARRVLVDELRPERADQQEAFLADVRAKAAVEHPLVGSVYEAVSEPGLCYFAHELLPGATLNDRRKAREPFKPGFLAHLLRRISDAQIQYETQGLATAPIGLENVHVDEHGVIRLDNLALAQARAPEHSERDIVHLGEALRPLVADGQPGSTRMLTLLGWMRGEGVDAPLSWSQVRGFCEQIEQQLAEPLPPSATTKVGQGSRWKPSTAMISIAAGLGLIIVIALAMRMRPPAPPAEPLPIELPESVLIPAGTYPTPDGTDEEFQAFRIGTHEVTIREYAAFLEILETLAQDSRERIFDHESQPPEKTSHVPDDWSALLAAAKAKGTWNQRPVTLDCPVVGVDWWDASAYAEWKHARLATQEQWFAALRCELAKPSVIQPASWIPVTSETADRTPKGLVGMAGSVSEWTRRSAPNPANPLGKRMWVIVGGSYLKPGSNALTREWSEDRSLRRPDLGFRLVFDAD